MSAGCPVICGQVASLPEVADDAAFHADSSPEDFARAIRQVQDDDVLRAQLVERGFRRAQQFSWAKCAEETTAVWREVLRA